MIRDKDIERRVKYALSELLRYDKWLLTRDASERCIVHKLAIYIEKYFKKYDVDCEYNSNVENDRGKKRIFILMNELERLGNLTDRERETELEIIERLALPDIIIHKRAMNSHNLCIIEIKKSTNNISSDYDVLKLKSYTTDDLDNELKYQLGIFIMINVGDTPSFQLQYFKNGNKIAIE